jgi:signal transduction histidine kinase
MRWLRLSLRGRIIAVFAAMVAMVMIGEAIILWYASHMNSLLATVIEREFQLYRTGQDMELALANQKGLLTYYLVDGDNKWLQSLGEQREIFRRYLERARELELDDQQERRIQAIGAKFGEYAAAKDEAINDYQKSTRLGSISALHEKQREIFFSLLEACRRFNEEQWQRIVAAQTEGARLTRELHWAQIGGLTSFASLCAFFIFILYKQLLGPIRGLAIKTGGAPGENYRDEVHSLALSLDDMMRQFDEKSDELARSRRHLLQVERLAMVGELAAGVAHTIRNPFTSIKMRMFSLTRSLSLSEVQNEDLQVIADEITRIDRIVQNFLEFARPPKLRLSPHRLGEVVQSVLNLLEYRLKSFNVEVQHYPCDQVGPVLLDSDRIKEALVNLLINACEAMDGGGGIDIVEGVENDPQLGAVATLMVRDHGPGIPIALLDKVTTPFFTTKEEGSGLGLSIVARIVREHRGKLEVGAAPQGGAQCTMKLPLSGRHDEPHPHH